MFSLEFRAKPRATLNPAKIRHPVNDLPPMPVPQSCKTPLPCSLDYADRPVKIRAILDFTPVAPPRAKGRWLRRGRSVQASLALANILQFVAMRG